MSKVWTFVLGLLPAFCICLPLVAFADQRLEGATDRPGDDMTSVPIEPSIAPAEICRGICKNTAHCNSWTLVNAGIQGPKAICWLKNGVPPAVANNCCQSGVIKRTVERGIDRPGGDYFHGQNTGNYDECQSSCEKDPGCKAWTYVNRGVQGPIAICYLKNVVPDANDNAGTVSGVPIR